MKIKTALPAIILILFTIIFVAIPLPSSDLYIRVHFFNDTVEDKCYLYYALNEPYAFNGDQYITAEFEPDENQVTFCIDGSLADQISGLRLDFSGSQDLVCINSISVSSAGIIKEDYNPCVFFSAPNIAQSNDVEFTLIEDRNIAYIVTGSSDPYIVLTTEATADIVSHFSRYRLTRLGICLFIAIAYILAKKKLFTEK